MKLEKYIIRLNDFFEVGLALKEWKFIFLMLGIFGTVIGALILFVPAGWWL